MSVHGGIWNLDGKPVDPDFLARISQTVAEYGCDGETTYFDGPIGILHRPFHTTSESRLEHQPFVSISGRVLTWDGRLDNRDELIQQLWSDSTDRRSDVTIAAAALDRWGTDFFAKLVGDWAISIWDPRAEELLIARDYVGVKHLFYYPTPTRLIWCNHLAPLTLCGDHFTLCDQYIAGYFASYPDADLTPYQEIHSVAPGHFVRVVRGRLTSHAYWRLPNEQIHYKTDAEYEEHYRVLLRKSVRRRLRADSPVLAELSGGLDSSSVVCMADDIMNREGAEAPRVDTFSYYDSEEPGEDDLLYIAKVEERRGKIGHRADLRGSGDSIPLTYSAFSAVPGFGSRTEIKAAISDLSRKQQYRVMLCGTGGDEINGQTLHPRVLLADLLIRCRLMELNQQLVSWSLIMRRPWAQLIYETLMHLLPLALRSKLTEHGQLEPWVNRRFARRYSLSARQTTVLNSPWFFDMRVRNATHTSIFLARQMTYASPSLIERRYPYLDQELVEFLSAVPLNQLLRPGQQRSLMRRALALISPKEVLSRKTKASAARCYAVSLHKHWDKVEALLACPLILRLGYVDSTKLRAALRAMRSGHIHPHFLRLFKALFLELWLQEIQVRGVISCESPPTALAEI